MAAHNGHANIVPAEKGNFRAVKHGLHSERTLMPEVREIADKILAVPHLSAALDEIGVVELAGSKS